MDEKQIKLVQDSFAQVVPIAGTAATLFYDRLFETTPQVKELFKGDLDKQKLALMQTLGVVVVGLSKLDTILPAVKNLAVRHKDYGVQAEHFENVGASLLWTLEKGLGDSYTPEVHEAWVAAYTLLSGVMIETMASPN
jgi:hemoglobin-like flavoprotein